MSAKGKENKGALFCSFCGKNQDGVKKLVAGPGVYICDECIELCNEIVSDEWEASGFDKNFSDLPKPKQIKEALDQYVIAVLAVLVALIFGYSASGMFQSLDQLLEGDYLFVGAGRIARLLNGGTHSGYGSVRYFIFGHDHAASARPLPPTDKDRPPHRQWYVNTGAWVPVFSESERLLRSDEHLTFLRLVPSRVQHRDESKNRDLPELLQWSPQANAPLEVRLFGD